ncbi:hypothetical protein F2Q69_00044219 [Brassica cretica]|uniref:Ubiquitin-like protease family profile domain-containing protein n=1 Tax=Brassica cretica TaxID=69181 RepID=A0A8S9NPA4_BRACR|nr:hypothetical protein F2Q69_00044219 [Brassica cretica]
MKLPEMIFADGEEPVGVRALTYQSSRSINTILNALDEEEIQAIKMLRKRTVTEKDIRMKLACLAIVFSVLLSTNLKMKMLKEHAELLGDMEESLPSPGLVIVEAVPSLTEVVKESCSSSESDSDEDDVDGVASKTKKKTLSPEHAREVDKKEKVLLWSILPQDPARPVDESVLVWPDEVVDIKVAYMLSCISANHVFTKNMFRGGVTKGDVERMREKAKAGGRKKALPSKAKVIATVKGMLKSLKTEIMSSSHYSTPPGLDNECPQSVNPLACTQEDNTHGNEIVSAYSPKSKTLDPTPTHMYLVMQVLAAPTHPQLSNQRSEGNVEESFENRPSRFRHSDLASLRNFSPPSPLVMMRWETMRTSWMRKTIKMVLEIHRRHYFAIKGSTHYREWCVCLRICTGKVQNPLDSTEERMCYKCRGPIRICKEITDIGARTRLLTGRVIDILMRVIAASVNSQVSDRGHTTPLFLDSRVQVLLSMNFPKFRKSKTQTQYVFTKALVDIVKKSLNFNSGLSHFYMPVTIARKHWVAVCVDITTAKIYVLDCNPDVLDDKALSKELAPVTEMFPSLLKHCGALVEYVDKAVVVERMKGVVKNTNPADAAITACLLIQTHALYGAEICSSITPLVIPEETQRAAVMIYEFHEMV